jgi:hypothetical protein
MININLSYYQIHYIYIEEVNVTNHFSKETIVYINELYNALQQSKYTCTSAYIIITALI